MRWFASLLVPSLGLVLLGCQPPQQPAEPTLEVRGALGGAPDPGFARATEPRQFVFPLDHGPHPEYRNEWWYVTGNLQSEDGDRFGFQVTFFRIAVSPEQPVRSSRWSTNQVWMAHFAVTDVSAGVHRSSPSRRAIRPWRAGACRRDGRTAADLARGLDSGGSPLPG